MFFDKPLRQVPSLFKSKTEVSDNCTVKLVTDKLCWMFESDFRAGCGPVFESRQAATECAGPEDKIVRVSLSIV